MYPIFGALPGPWGAVTVYAFGVCLGAGLLSAWLCFSRYAEQSGRLDEAERATLFVRAATGVVFGAGLTCAALAMAGGFAHHEIARASTVGGLVGCLSLGLSGPRVLMASKLGALDMLVPAMALGYAWVQMGWYLDGSSYGAPLEVSAPDWLSNLGTFPEWVDPISGIPTGLPLAFADAARDGLIDPSLGSPPALHPVQLYEASWALCVSALSAGLWGHWPRRGQSGITAIVLLGLGAFIFGPYHHEGGLVEAPMLTALNAAITLGAVVAYLKVRGDIHRATPNKDQGEPSL